jgi:SAM-dependent methyltransferase
VRRYGPHDIEVFTPSERERFLRPLGIAGPEDAVRSWARARRDLAWELLYRLEPDLYERLVAGEHVHPAILDCLPQVDRAVEAGAGLGRFTVELARRAGHVVAVEPAAALRERLRARVRDESLDNVRVEDGFFDELPVPDASAGLVVACSAFTVESEHGGDAGLAEMERVCAPGGIVAVVWPDDPEWLRERGFAHIVFEGGRQVVFESVDEAVAVARVFYPDAVSAIRAAGVPAVPYDLLGRPGPQDLSWKRIPS